MKHSHIDTAAQNAIAQGRGDLTLRAYAQRIGENAGYLSAIINGKRPASRRLRVKLGLASKYPPHPVVRWSMLRRVLGDAECDRLMSRVYEEKTR
jgi:hypothetical protein